MTRALGHHNEIPLQLRNGVYLVTFTINGKHKLLGIVDSGASSTHVTAEARKRAGLEYTGTARKFMCIHGVIHKDLKTRSYHGMVTLGTKSGSGIVYETVAPLVVGGQRVDAVLGRDILCNFNVSLCWKDGTGG